jgi:hypothetical protein
MSMRQMFTEVVASLIALAFFALGYLIFHDMWHLSEPIASGAAVVFALGTRHTMFGTSRA